MEAEKTVTTAPQAEAEWSQEDKDWLMNHVNPSLRGVAMRYGRQLFSMTLRVGLLNHCVAVLAARLQKNPELSQMVQLTAAAINDQSMWALKGLNVTLEQLMECKTDIETIGALQAGTPQAQARQSGENVSPGGIILNS